MIYHRDNPRDMNSSKSEDSILPSNIPGKAARENAEKKLARKLTPTYELTAFSKPALDQLNDVLPDFNKRLSQDRDLRLSPLGHSRLSPQTLPRLVSDSCNGLSSSDFPNIVSRRLQTPVGKGLEIKPDLAGRMLRGSGLCGLTINPDLPIAPLESRLITLRRNEEFKEEKEGNLKYNS